MIATGVDSLKIEGRMKSAYYVGTVVGVPQSAGRLCRQSDEYVLDPQLLAEVNKVSHRPYYPGFLWGADRNLHDKFGVSANP